MRLIEKLGIAVVLGAALVTTAQADSSDTERPAKVTATTTAPDTAKTDTPPASTAGQSILQHNLRTVEYTRKWLAERPHRAKPEAKPQAPQTTVNVRTKIVVRQPVASWPYRSPYYYHSSFLYVGSGYYRLVPPYRYDYACRYLSDCPCRYLTGC